MNKFFVLTALLGCFFMSPLFTSAASIISDDTHVWAENVGWIDFSQITVSDESLGGSAYGENIGWIDLSSVSNDGEGSLSGYAWAENVGWIDFSAVSIDGDGFFEGKAYGENIGWIDLSGIQTNWEEESSGRKSGRSGGGGGGGSSKPPVNTNPLSVVPGTPSITFVPNQRDLTTGFSGEDVRDLQKFLNTHGFPISLTGIGSAGNETDYFGGLTRAALSKFQAANGIVPAVGYFGPITRAFIINLLNK